MRTSRNTLTHLWDDNGHKVEDVEQMKEVAVSFYKNLLGTSYICFENGKADGVRQLVHTHITEQQVVDLQKEVLIDEIKRSLFGMKHNKAFGPDRYTVEFFKSTWPVVGQDVVATIQDFFISERLLKEVNAQFLH